MIMTCEWSTTWSTLHLLSILLKNDAYFCYLHCYSKMEPAFKISTKSCIRRPPFRPRPLFPSEMARCLTVHRVKPAMEHFNLNISPLPLISVFHLPCFWHSSPFLTTSFQMVQFPYLDKQQAGPLSFLCPFEVVTVTADMSSGHLSHLTRKNNTHPTWSGRLGVANTQGK